MEVLKKILNIVIDIFIVFVVIISAVIAIISLSSQEDGVPKFFGYVPLSVQSESMSPTFEEGDMIVGKSIDRDFDFKKGDVVTYWMLLTDDTGVSQSVLNTHRIIDFETVDGEEFLITQGDHNKDKDPGFVSKQDAVAVWSENGNDEAGIKIEKLGSVLSFLRKPSGFFIAVVIPMAIFFIYELVRFIMNFMNYNREKSKEAALEAAKELMGDSSSDSSGLSEEQKAQAILEYLEKQKAEEGTEKNPTKAAPAEAQQPAEAAQQPAEEPAQEESAEEPVEEPAAEQTAQSVEEISEQPETAAPAADIPEATQAEEIEQPASAEATTAVTEPEQESSVSDASED